jgi:uncharacterized membrane protein YkgB
MLARIGGPKSTAGEADAIRPLVETSPLPRWAYLPFSARAFSTCSALG